MLAIVCPGQGSQTPGFLTPWLELPGVSDQLASLSNAAKLDLAAYGTTADADTIRDTAIAQPLIVAAGLVTHHVLAERTQARPSVLAGHSVGEFTAAALAGVLTEEQAMTLIGVRSRAMAEAAAATPTGMSAVLGGDPDEVRAAISDAGLTAANVNGGGQVVAAGTLEELAAFGANPPAKARVMPLQVAGAFHTRHMRSAVAALSEAAAGVDPRNASITLLSNADGKKAYNSRQALDRLVTQVANPVRWDLCMATLLELGVTGLVELSPAGALTGLAKRAMKGVATLALKSPDDLDAAVALMNEHASDTSLEVPQDLVADGEGA